MFSCGGMIAAVQPAVLLINFCYPLVPVLHTPHQPVHLHWVSAHFNQCEQVASGARDSQGSFVHARLVLLQLAFCDLVPSAQQGRAPDLTAKVASSSRDDVKQICNDAGITADVQLFQPAKDSRLCSSHPTKTVVSSVTPVASLVEYYA